MNQLNALSNRVEYYDFSYYHNYLYSFSTVGQKIEWIRANPLVCVEADEVVSPQQWASVTSSATVSLVATLPVK